MVHFWLMFFSVRKKQFQQGFIAREGATIFGQLAQAHVHRFDSIGGIDDFANFRRVVKERYQPQPVAL